MNSFRFLEDGVRAEIERQTALLESGEPVVQETIHFDPRTGRLSPLRSKEEAHDYRYFPEPDLVPLEITPEMLEAARAALPELPAARAERLQSVYGLAADRAHELAFRTELGDYFERAASVGDGVDPGELANWIPQLVERIGSDTDPASSSVTPAALAALARMVSAKHLSRGNAREVLDGARKRGRRPAGRSSRRRASARSATTERSRRRWIAAIAADPAAADQAPSAGNQKAMGPLIAARDARDQGQSRRGRGHARDARAARSGLTVPAASPRLITSSLWRAARSRP